MEALPINAAQEILDYALSFPEVALDHPWGEHALKVRGKVFVFLHADEQAWSMSTKLPTSMLEALQQPYTSPTGYGLGRSGWVSSRFRASDEAPVDLLKSWVDESYRAIAPKRLVRTLA